MVIVKVETGIQAGANALYSSWTKDVIVSFSKVHPYVIYKKGDEAGYFGFGGSTVVLLFKKDSVDMHKSFSSFSNKEVTVKMGQAVGLSY